MTQVIFDVVDLVGEVHPGDTVSVWPPYVASTVDGRVRSTRKIDVLVDEGPVTEDIEPGPMVVQLQCKGIVDTKPRTVTIPDAGTITLANLLQSTFTYTPAVVSQVSLDAQRAEDAAARAETTVGSAEAVIEARDDTVAAVATLGDAQTVLTARDQAVAAAAGAAESTKAEIRAEMDSKVSEAEQSAQSAGEAEVAAAGSATSASTDAGRAETAAEEIQNVKAILPLNVKEYGAVGDGVTDDTAAIQSTINDLSPGQTLLIPHGRFVISSRLNVSTNSVKIFSQGTLVAGAGEISFMSISGHDVEAVLRLNGLNSANMGVSVTGSRCIIRDGVFENFHSATQGAYAVSAATSGGVTVTGNVFRNIHAESDGITGNDIGSSRAVFVHSSTPAVADTFISSNVIERVTGEEGDAIHVLFGSSPFLNGRVTITGNQIAHVPRRAIKVQASGTVVTDNVYRHGTAGESGDSAASLINIIHSDSCVVSGNVLDASFLMGIAVAGASSRPVQNVTVSGNEIVAGTSKVGIYFGDYVSGSTCSENVVTGGSVGIWVTNVTDSTISRNVLKGETTGSISMRLISTCQRVIVSGNSAFGGGRDWMIQNDAPGTVLENNHARWTTGTGGGVRLAATSVGSVCRANSATPGPAVYSGTGLPGMLVSQNRGNSDTLGGDIVWCRTDPATDLAGVSSVRGDIAFAYAPSEGGNVGWVCITSGTPGVWKPFGQISD